MERLTVTSRYRLPDTFRRCHICGHESKDICEFRFWQECDKDDVPEPYNILITCNNKSCFHKIRDHARLYVELAWSHGLPGHLSLLCDECSYRDGYKCTHPKLKTNGGEGLWLAQSKTPVSSATVCYHTDANPYGLACRTIPHPFTSCEGLPEDDPRHYHPKEEIEGR